MAASCGRVCSTRSVSLFLLQTLLCSCMICTWLCTARALATPAAAGSGMREYHLRGNHMKSAYDQLELEGRTMQQGQVVANDTEEELSDYERRELTVYSLDDYCTGANSKHDPTPPRCP